MLHAYLQQVQRLLQDETQARFNLKDLVTWTNTARGQLAGEAECIRVIGTVSTVVGQRPYNFSSINIGTPATTGVQGVIHVRRINYGVGSGQKWLAPRPWEWFDLYYLNNPVPTNAAPERWSQFAQGSAGTNTGSGSSGSFYLDPPPNAIYTLYCDCVCYPIALTDDSSVEAIPYLWTDAVPYFAAYLAFLSAQQLDRAKAMMDLYAQFVQRARKAANSGVLRWQSQQATDPAQIAKMGFAPASSGGGA